MHFKFLLDVHLFNPLHLCIVPHYIITGFVLLLEVLEKPWYLILDFKGA